MADNVSTQSSAPATPAAGTVIAARSVTYSGDTALIAPVGLVEFAGSDDAKTATDVAIGSIIGAVTETAPATDTASSGLNGRLQRIAQRLTSLITALGSPFQAGGSIGNTSFASTVADGANAVEGVTTGAAVITDANGTVQQYLRGLVKLLITSGTIVLGAGANLIGYVGQKVTYAGKVTLATTNFTSLAAGSGWQSVSIATGGARDVHFRIQTKSVAAGVLYLDFYVAETMSNDTTYTDGASGSEAAYTAAGRLNSRYLGSVRMNATTAVQGTLKLSDVFGVIPAKFALIAINGNASQAMSATPGDHVFDYELVN